MVNDGMKISKGDCVLFLGQDDVLPCNHISNMIKKFDFETSFIYCNSTIIDSNGIEKYITYDGVNQTQITKI